jgi:hypothetical protein
MSPTEAPLNRDRLLATAENVIRRFDPAKAIVVDVARPLGVSHAAVYRHVATKAELRTWLAGGWRRPSPASGHRRPPGPGPTAVTAAFRRPDRRQTLRGHRRPEAVFRLSDWPRMPRPSPPPTSKS